MRFTADRELPPRSKKSSSGPMPDSPRTSDHTARSRLSTSAADSCPAGRASGAGGAAWAGTAAGGADGDGAVPDGDGATRCPSKTHSAGMPGSSVGRPSR